MKLTLSTGTSAKSGCSSAVQTSETIRSVYMAPLGKPVLPEVYRIMASRWSVSPVYGGSRRQRPAALQQFVEGLDGHRHAGFGQLRPGPLHVLPMVVDLGLVVENHQAPQRRAAQRRFDGQVEIACAGGEYPRFDLGDDRLQAGRLRHCVATVPRPGRGKPTPGRRSGTRGWRNQRWRRSLRARPGWPPRGAARWRWHGRWPTARGR